MTTLAAGTSAQIYCALASDMTITPGDRARFGCSSPEGTTAPAGRTIHAAETITIPAGSTVFLEAVGADATYTDPNLTSSNVAALKSGWLKPTAALFGDSFSQRVNSSLVNYRQSDHSYWTWANILLGSPMTLVGNFGVSGETTTQMLARIDAVEAAGAGIVFVQGGINDLSASVPVATVAANLVTICDRLRQGATVVLLNLAPNETNAAGVAFVNAALANYARTVGNVILVDVFSAVIDSTSTAGAFATGMSDDDLHLTAKGAKAYGAAIVSAISKYMPTVPLLPASASDSVAVLASSAQILANPLMSGSGGTVSGTGASGTVATSWSAGTDSGTLTSVWLHGQARSDGIGVDQQVTVSSAGASSTINMRQTSGLTARVAAGDTIFACGSISLSGMTDVARVQPSLSITVGGVAYTVHCLDHSDTTWDQSDATLNWRTPDFLLTEAPTVLQFFYRIRFGSSGAGACVAKFGRTGVYKYA